MATEPLDPWAGVTIDLTNEHGSRMGADLAEQAFKLIAQLNRAGGMCDHHANQAFQAVAVWALAAYVWLNTEDDTEPGDLIWDTLILTAKAQLDQMRGGGSPD